MVEGTLQITISNQSAHIPVTSITVSGAGGATTISVDGGDLQMSATILPVDASDQTVTWSVIGTAGFISGSGLLTALSNGIITVRATANDGSGVYSDILITITNQPVLTHVPDRHDFSLRDVCNVVIPTLNTLRTCFIDALATLFDPTHVVGFDTRYEGNHDRLSNFRNYPVIDYVEDSSEGGSAGPGYGALYNWHAVKNIGNNKLTYGGLYNWYATTKKTTSNPSKDNYGGIYNWYAATYNIGGASIAPAGWHVPTQTELNALITAIGGNTLGGAKLRETGIVHWDSPNDTATNEYGFNGIGGGMRNWGDGTFESIKSLGGYWVSTENPYQSGSYEALVLLSFSDYLSNGESTFYEPHSGMSIRLIKDDSSNPGTLTDIDGNVYDCVTIGSQVWTASNLKVEHYNDSTAIPIITDGSEWTADAAGAMCYYDNEPTIVEEYLLPPAGWHVPTNDEFETLKTELGGWEIAGGKLKETGLLHWDDPNTGADNSSGFNGRGGGSRSISTGEFVEKNIWARFLSLDDIYTLHNSSTIVERSFSILGQETLGCSVRLIKDNSVDPKTMTDYDGNVYPTVKIGDQVWMAENLRVEHFKDGSSIPIVTGDAEWAALTTEGMCYYENESTGTPSIISPARWHVPTITEWNTLIATLGGQDVAGGKLREVGTDHWNSPNTSAIDDSDFAAEGGGWRTFLGGFENIRDYGFWWASTLHDPVSADRVFLDRYDTYIYPSNSTFNMGFSVRLIKDDDTDPGTMTDYDGNEYPTVKIGDQVWMAKNLRVVHYNDGTDIENPTANADWHSNTTGAYCWYNNIPE
jgi:uncharacterized protein (TIGR02145 family)